MDALRRRDAARPFTSPEADEGQHIATPWPGPGTEFPWQAVHCRPCKLDDPILRPSLVCRWHRFGPAMQRRDSPARPTECFAQNDVNLRCGSGELRAAATKMSAKDVKSGQLAARVLSIGTGLSLKVQFENSRASRYTSFVNQIQTFEPMPLSSRVRSNPEWIFPRTELTNSLSRHSSKLSLDAPGKYKEA